MKIILPLILAMFCMNLFAIPTASKAAVSDWQKGMSIVPNSPTDFASPDMRLTLKQIKQLGGNYVTLIIPYTQSSITTTDIQRDRHTPTDQALRQAVQWARTEGLGVQFAIHQNARGVTWRARINPPDRETWFSNYKQVLLHYGKMAEELGVEQYCLGVELISMTDDDTHPDNTMHWEGLISSVRGVYSGKLTYTAQWGVNREWTDEKHQVGFWDKLDIMGITNYPTIIPEDINATSSIVSAWASSVYAKQVQEWQRAMGKPYLIAETGYRSVGDTIRSPWDWATYGASNPALQARAYDAFFQYWGKDENLQGVHFWYWQPVSVAGGEWDMDFTTQGKPANGVIANWFGGTAPATPPAIATFNNFPKYINSGGAGFTDTQGRQWLSDQGYYGGITHVDMQPVDGSSAPYVYQSERYSTSTYAFFVPEGNYRVVLKFAEVYFTSQNKRVFNVDINGMPALVNFDIYKEAGAKFKPVDKTIPVSASQGKILIELKNVTDKAKISGIEIHRADGTPVPPQDPPPNQNPAPTSTPITASFSAQASQPSYSGSTGSIQSISASITPQNGRAENVLVDLEIYDHNGQKVFQQYFEGEEFDYNQTKQFPINWRPDTAGQYTLMLGVFGGGWSPNYYWSSNLASISITAATTPPPPSNNPTTTPPTLSCTTPGDNSFTGCYYDNQDFTNLKVLRNDQVIDFDWAAGSPDPSVTADTFSARWQGNFQFESGEYEFTTTANDGVRVYVNDVRILDKWFDQVPTTYKVTRPMTAGTHTVTVEYYEGRGTALVKHAWIKKTSPVPPQEPPQNPPPGNPACPAAATNAFTACYYNNEDLTSFATSSIASSINFDWGNGSPVSTVEADTYSATWTGNFAFDAAEYDFLVTGDDGIRLYVDDILILDKWIDQPPTTYNHTQSMTTGPHKIKLEYYEKYGGATAKLSWQKKTSTPPVFSNPFIDLWWPSDGSSVSGTVLLKAKISGLDVSQYNMYWQVDGDRLNDMFTSGSEKQAWVDVSGWSWRGNGPYQLNFVATRHDGSFIDEQPASIVISR